MDIHKLNQNRFIQFMISRKIIIIASLIMLYFLISTYFSNHFFFHTQINGVNLSLRSYKDADNIIENQIKNYELQLFERYNETEFITGQVIDLRYNERNSIADIYKEQKSLLWIVSIFKNQSYYLPDLYTFHIDKLDAIMSELLCMNREILAPRNVSFYYFNGAYKPCAEVYGNKVIKAKLREAIKQSIITGETGLDLNDHGCYEDPEYILSSVKTSRTVNLLNKYAATKVTYRFGESEESLSGDMIHEWLYVDNKLDVRIDKNEVIKYISELSKKYDTVGITRQFHASTGKIVELKGGLYGWKIYQEGETKELIEIIRHGETIEKEPIYIQKALSRVGNEIGNTYVEINITRQYLWFYKNGKLIAQGAVVTGNPNRGNATVVGAYMLNYKQDGATLKGLGYEVDVNYWMPFFGNMGIHDARWRSSFGGEIYKSRGTHGCVNAPYYLAKKIFENIEVGIPIITYEE